LAVTIRDVARVAGVSISAVSAALNNKLGVSKDTRLRIIAVAEKLRYEPNILAKGLITKKSYIIGLIISDISNPFFSKVIRGIEDIANENNFNLVLCNADEDPQKEKAYLRVLQGRQVDGLIVAPTNESNEYIKELVEKGIPAVLLDRKLNGIEVDSVTVDNVEGSYKAVSHLIHLGHKRIGIISGPKNIMTGGDRLEGYLKSLREHHLTINERLIKEGNFRQESGYDKACEFLKMRNPPRAVFIANNLMTLGALKALRERKIKIPGEMSIVGFDDMAWTSLVDPPLTIISQPTYTLGSCAAKLLLQRIKGEAPAEAQQITLKTKLIIRGPCGKSPL